MVQPANKRLLTEAKAGEHAGDPATPLGAALVAAGAAYSPRAMPSYAGTGRTKTFDAARSIYNTTSPNLGKIRARIANGVIGGGGRCHVLFEAHSYMAGSQATPGMNDTVSSLKKILPARTGGAVYASISAFSNGETRDSHYTGVTAGWSAPNHAAKTIYGVSTTLADEFTYTSTEAATVLSFWITNDSTDFSYSIDGGAATTVSTPHADAATDPLKLRVITVSGLSNAIHTLKIVKTGTGPTKFAGAGVRGSANGIELYNFGYGGSTSADWISLTSGEKRAAATTIANQRDVVLIQLDTNDARANLTGAQWKASIAQVISSHVGLSHPTALILSPPASSGVTVARWNEYGLAAYELAEQYDIPVLDLRHALGEWTQIQGSTISAGDDIHLNTRGYYREALAVAGLLVD